MSLYRLLWGKPRRVHSFSRWMWVFGVYFLCLCPLFSQEEDAALSLKQCEDIALANSEEIQQAGIAKENILTDVKDIISAMLPSLDGSLSYDYNFAIQKTVLPDFISPSVYRILENEDLLSPQARDFSVLPAEFGTKHTARVGLGLSQRLFDIRYILAVETIPLLRRLADAQYLLAKEDIIIGVRQTYYLVQVAEKQVLLAQNNMQRIAQLWAETQAMYENGFAESVDVKRLEVNYNLAKGGAQTAENERKIALRMLNFVMGKEIDAPLFLLDTMDIVPLKARREELAPYLLRPTFEENLTSYRLLDMQEKAAKVDERSIKLSRLPTLRLQGSAGYNMGSNDVDRLFSPDNWFGFGSVGIRLQLPIFTGGQWFNDVQRKKLIVRQLQTEKTTLKKRLLSARLQAQEAFERHVEDVETQQENVLLAQEVYDIIRLKYQEGLSSSFELLDAAFSLQSGQTDYYMALYRALNAMTSYERSLGLLLNE